MAEESDLERTEPASQRRLEQAREEGQIARSPELAAFAVMLAALATVWFMSGPVMKALARLASQGLSFDSVAAHDPSSMFSRLTGAAFEAIVIAAPLLVAVVVAALVAPPLIGGWAFTLKFDFQRMDPIQGFSRLFSMRGVTELLKAVLKALVIGIGATIVLWKTKESMLAFAGQSLDASLPTLGDLVMRSDRRSRP